MRVFALLTVLSAACFLTAVSAESGTNRHLWSDTEFTTHMWQTISTGNKDDLEKVLAETPEKVMNARARDGRGPLWWAYEYERQDMVDMLIAAGLNQEERDADGKTAKDIFGKIGETEFMKAQAEAEKKQWAEANEASAAADEEEEEN